MPTDPRPACRFTPGDLVCAPAWDASERPENRIGIVRVLDVYDHMSCQSGWMVEVDFRVSRDCWKPRGSPYLWLDSGWLEPAPVSQSPGQGGVT